MDKRLELEYVDVTDYDEWAVAISRILADGVFRRLRQKGLLRRVSTIPGRPLPAPQAEEVDGPHAANLQDRCQPDR